MTTDWAASREPAGSLLDAIGRTPLVRLARVAPDVELFAKVEWYGPTGSVKDRIYAAMLTRAEERGELKPGMTIIECTTGNAGIACSAVAAIKGYPCVIVMPEGMSPERRRMIAAYGAELVLTPGAGTDIDLALAKMREIVAADPARYFFPGEFENPDNPQAQERSGEEIWEQSGGVDAVVASQGTGGWITGAARALKRHRADVLAYAVEPAECPLISEQRWGTHGVPGIGDGIVAPNLDLAVLDGVVVVSTDESLEMARLLASAEGLLVRSLLGDERRRGAEGRREASGARPDRDGDPGHRPALPQRRAVRRTAGGRGAGPRPRDGSGDARGDRRAPRPPRVPLVPDICRRSTGRAE